MESVNLANPEANLTFAWSAADLAGNRSRPSFPNASLQSLFDLIDRVRSLQPRPESMHLQCLAFEAVTALQTRADEDIDTWAAQLAGDVVEAID